MASTAASTSSLLFNDVFTIKDVDRDGKKFDRVSRISGNSHNQDMEMTLDVNTDLINIKPNSTLTFALASSLVPEGEKKPQDSGWRAGIDGSIADDWEYVMYGKVYKFDEEAGDKVTAYASFGGLLLALSGSYRHVSRITVGEYVYLLIRR